MDPTGQQGPPAIELQGVTKRFGDVQAVDGVDLVIRPGEIVAYLGPNGAGKTTTIDMVLGLTRPDAGTASVFGLAPGEAVRRGLVSAVLQNGGLLKDLTVAETVQYTSLLFPVTRPVAEVMDRAGIAGIGGRRVGRCSGGEQQRLRFAMALLSDPALLILDEPTQGMDVEGRRDFWGAIRQDAAQGRTVVFATHYLEEADAYADRVVLVRRGRVVADGTAGEIRAMASGRTVRATFPTGPAAQAAAVAVGAIDGVEAAEVRGASIVVTATDTDVVARHLLTATDAHGLEVTARGLEDAFVALTSDPPVGSPGAPEGVARR